MSRMTLAIIQVNSFPKCHHVVSPTLSKNTKRNYFVFETGQKISQRTQNGAKLLFSGGRGNPENAPWNKVNRSQHVFNHFVISLMCQVDIVWKKHA